MSVRCPQCFYENEERYRFCGMCGVALPRIGSAPSERDASLHRAPAPEVNSDPEPAKERPPSPASVPSFLGLSQDQNPYPDRSLDYLLEDEPEPSRTRMYLAIVLLVAAVAMLAWRWRHSGFFSPTPHAVVTTTGSPTPNSPDASAPETSASPASSSPATSSNTAPAPNPSKQAGHSAPQESDLPANGTPTDEASKSAQPEQPSGSGPDDSSPAAAKPDTASTIAAIPVPVEKPARIVKPKAPRAAPAQVVPAASLQDPSETEGEKYLYGHGVPQNCARAEKSLLSAAQHANPKAQSVLGTMYATGHCVGRDLPTAYRWFAKASHQDPNNARITRDLEVLWKQMTPGERQLAVNNRE